MNTMLRYAPLLLVAAAVCAQAEPAPDRRSVTVNGHGEVMAVPDRARLAMAIDVTQPDLRSAQTEVNRIARDYLAQLKTLGVKDDDVSTAGLSVRAEYDYSPKTGSRRFVGYHINRGISIVVRELDKVGDVLLKATASGINSVSEPQLESSKADELQRQALAKAADDARANAKALADALGARLGAIHTLNASTESGPLPLVATARFKTLSAAAPEASGNDEIGFSAGQIRFSATLSADFDLSAP